MTRLGRTLKRLHTVSSAASDIVYDIAMVHISSRGWGIPVENVTVQEAVEKLKARKGKTIDFYMKDINGDIIIYTELGQPTKIIPVSDFKKIAQKARKEAKEAFTEAETNKYGGADFLRKQGQAALDFYNMWANDKEGFVQYLDKFNAQNNSWAASTLLKFLGVYDSNSHYMYTVK